MGKSKMAGCYRKKKKNRIKYKWIQKNCRRFEGKELYVCGQTGQD